MTKRVYVIIEYMMDDICVLGPIYTIKEQAEEAVKKYDAENRKTNSYYYPQYSIDDYELVGDND